MKRFLLSMLACGFIGLVNGQSAEYTLHFSEESLREVRIVATIPLNQPILRMNGGGIPAEVADGWARFVTIDAITTSSGQPIAFSWHKPQQCWRLSELLEQTVQVVYRVALTHDDFDWSSVGGKDARPSLFPGPSIFWVTKSLFVVPENEITGPISVHFEVPKNWEVSTSWIQDHPDQNTYRVPDMITLTNNLLMVGRHGEETIKQENMSITLAMTPDLKQRTALFRSTLEKILTVYKEIFGELPEVNYLICISGNFFDDGEAFRNSFHQMLNDQDLESRKIVWVNVMAHEMFHYWNGTNFLRGANVQNHYWFSEGFTEYYSNLALVKAGVVPEEIFLSKLAFQFSRYFTAKFMFPPPRPSLVSAGAQKNRNWGLIYGGGATLAFVLDVKIRADSQGKLTLDDVFRHLYQAYGKQGQTLSEDRLITSFNEVTGSDYREFFQQYVSGNEILPLLESIKTSGMSVSQYQGEFYLKLNDHPNSIMKQIMLF